MENRKKSEESWKIDVVHTIGAADRVHSENGRKYLGINAKVFLEFI